MSGNELDTWDELDDAHERWGLWTYHEAGHAAATLALGRRCPDLFVRKSRDAPCHPGATGVGTAMVAVAGPVAEAVQSWCRDGDGVDGMRLALRSGAPLDGVEHLREELSVGDYVSAAAVFGGMADFGCGTDVVTESGEEQLVRDVLGFVLGLTSSGTTRMARR